MKYGEYMELPPSQGIVKPPPTKKPIDHKVAVGGFVGAVAILLISIAVRLGVEISPTESGAITIILAKAFEYYAKN